MTEAKTGIDGELYVYNGTINWTGTNTVTGTRVGYVQGLTWSFPETNKAIWDRGTITHYLKGRKGPGEMNIPTLYFDSLALTAALAGTVTGSSAPRIQAELRELGTAGALEHTVQFSDIAFKNQEFTESEGDEVTSFGMNFDLFKIPLRSTSSRIGG